MSKTVKCRNNQGTFDEVSVEELIIRPAVYGLVFNDDKILLSPQWDGYDFPGGGLEKGENPEETLVREVFEETGLDVEPGPLVDIVNDYYHWTHGGKDKYYQSICMYYLGLNPKGEISVENLAASETDYVKKAVWMSVTEAVSLKHYNGVDSPALIKKAQGLL